MSAAVCRSSRVPAALGLIPAVAALLLLGCTPRQVVEPRRPDTELGAAGSLQQTREHLRAVRDSLQGTDEGARAQYALAYMNVFYGRETPDYDSALVEFNRFLDEYPRHEGVGLARTWVRVLTGLSESGRLSEICDSVSRQRVRLDSLNTRLRDSTEVLRKDIVRVTAERDSLLGRIRLLEEVIEAIEKRM